MKRRLIAITATAFLVTVIAIGSFALNGRASTAHAAYVPPPGSCPSWVTKVTTYHYTHHTYGPTTYYYTEWIEIDGLYSGSTFCGVARAFVCRTSAENIGVQALNTWYQFINGYTSDTWYSYWPTTNAGVARCFEFSNITMSGDTLTVDAQWNDYGTQEPDWATWAGF